MRTGGILIIYIGLEGRDGGHMSCGDPRVPGVTRYPLGAGVGRDCVAASPAPGHSPGFLTCTDACQRAAGAGFVLRRIPVIPRPVGRAGIFDFFVRTAFKSEKAPSSVLQHFIRVV
jgi:hypothetical protein